MNNKPLASLSQRKRRFGEDIEVEHIDETPYPTSADSTMLMPPPPLPSHDHQSTFRYGGNGLASSLKDKASLQTERLMESGASLLEGNSILLRDDGTWTRVQKSQKGSATDPVNNWSTHPAYHNHQQTSEGHNSDPSQNFRTELLPVDIDKHRQASDHGISNEDDSKHANTHPFHLKDSIYQQQSRRQRLPLDDHASILEPSQPLQTSPSHGSSMHRGTLLDHYRYQDHIDNQGCPSDILQREKKCSHGHLPGSYSGYRKTAAPLTPSPKKQGFTHYDSVASPFFKSNTAREHQGRLTFNNHRASGYEQFRSLVPSRIDHRQPVQNYQDLRDSVPNSLTKSNKFEDPRRSFAYSQRDDTGISRSPYFQRQRSIPSSTTPRTDAFASNCLPGQRSARHSLHNAALHGPSERGIGKSGPIRMSQEEKSDRRRGLGEYLAAQTVDNMQESLRTPRYRGKLLRR